MEVITAVVIAAAVPIVLGLLMAWAYATGYRNCARDMLEQMTETEQPKEKLK